MARFTGHESCPKCGSRDNVARYDDGSAWCFGCHYYEPPDGQRFIPKSTDLPASDEHTGLSRIYNAMVRDCSTEIPARVVDYCGRFGIGVPELLKAGGRWYPRTESLVFFYYDKEGTICCIQGRSFSTNRQTSKYHNWGTPYQVIDINGTRGTSIVITEDKLSAIKVARVADAFPALGTSFQVHKLVELKRRGYQRVVVWLDHDKWRESREIVEKAQWIGLSASSVLTEDDPKCYDEKTIEKMLS